MKSNKCFYCLNHGDGRAEVGKGWTYKCKLGIENDGLEDIKSCPSFSENKGFQLGGYYTHMHFEDDGGSGCLSWVIHGDGDFPVSEDEDDRWLRFHICDFRQIEEWVKVWGEELRKRGWVREDDEEEVI